MTEYVEIDKQELARLQIIDLAARQMLGTAYRSGPFLTVYDPATTDVLKQALETPSRIRGLHWFGKMPESRLK